MKKRLILVLGILFFTLSHKAISQSNYFDFGPLVTYLSGSKCYGVGNVINPNYSAILPFSKDNNDILCFYRNAYSYPMQYYNYVTISYDLQNNSTPYPIFNNNYNGSPVGFMNNNFTYIVSVYQTPGKDKLLFSRYNNYLDTTEFIGEKSWFPTTAFSDHGLLNLIETPNNRIYLLNAWRYNVWSVHKSDLYISYSEDSMKTWSNWIYGGHILGEGEINWSSVVTDSLSNLYICMSTSWGGDHIIFYTFDPTQNTFPDKLVIDAGIGGSVYLNHNTGKLAICYINNSDNIIARYSNISDPSIWSSPYVVDSLLSNAIHGIGNTGLGGLYENENNFYLWTSLNEQNLFEWDGDTSWINYGIVPKTLNENYFPSNKVISNSNGCAIVFQTYEDSNSDLYVHVKEQCKNNCLHNVNFFDWDTAGDPTSGKWIIKAGGSEIFQDTNGAPTYYVTPFDLINVEINGTIKVDSNYDNDWIGFVFGFKDPFSPPYTYHDFLLLDWKKETQQHPSLNYTGQEGFSLVKLNGDIDITNSDTTVKYFWGHNSNSVFNVMDTDYGSNKGWKFDTEHKVKLIYTLTKFEIYIDSVMVFSRSGCFEPGRFGFYNYSQEDVTYSDFSYEFITDFQLSENPICIGDTAYFTFLDSCATSFNFSLIDSLKWDFGDGNQLIIDNPDFTNINPKHYYSSADTFNVTLIAIDNQGCTDTVAKTLVVGVIPLANAGPDQTICFGDSVTLTATGGGNYHWSIGSTGGLFFSEYGEGSGNNKYLEIYNGTGNDILLSDYAILTNYNGNLWSGIHNFPLGTILPYGNVWVIANDAADPVILAEADEALAWNTSGYVTSFNGDDVRALVRINNADTTIIDIIGRYDLIDPGNGWQVAGVTEATVNHTLKRKSSICSGNNDWDSSAGTNANNSDWIVLPQDDWADIGSHNGCYLISTSASITVTPGSTTTYTVTVTNASGCSDSDEVTVEVEDCSCLKNVNFYDWKKAGNPGFGNWTIQSGGTQLLQSSNDPQTYYITPEKLINVRIDGKIEVTGISDDDYIGFVFGFNQPIDTPYTEHDLVLFDWKKAIQTQGNYTGYEGFALSRIEGFIDIYDIVSRNRYFLGHTNDSVFTQLDSMYGNNMGWIYNKEYKITLIYTMTNIKIFVDSSLIFDHIGCFKPGYFGFYNLSQPNVTYSDFSYQFITDFKIEQTPLCIEDTALFIYLDSCAYNFDFSTLSSLEWDFGDGTGYNNSNPNLSSINPKHYYNSPGTYQVRLIATDAQDCIDTAYKSITIAPLPPANAGNDTSICPGNCTILNAGGGINYLWNSGNTNSSMNVCPTTNTTYTVTVLDSLGCSSSDDVIISIWPLPTADAGADLTICENNCVNITASGGSSYIWNTGDITPVINVCPTSLTLYTVTVSDQNGCSDSDNITIDIIPLPVANAGPDDAICDYETYTLTGKASNQSSVLWTTSGDGVFTNTTILNPTYTPGYNDSVNGSVNLSMRAFGTIPCGDSVDMMTLTINPAPTPVISGSTEECEFATAVSYSTPTVVGNDYNWVVNGGTITFGQGTSQITIDWGFAGTGTITVTETVGSTLCFTTTPVYNVIIDPLPNVFNVTGGGSYCAGGTGIDVGLFGTETGINYQLQLNNVDLGAPVAGTGASLTWSDQTDAGTYTVIGTNTTTGCIDTMSGNAIIVINPLPQVFNVTGGGAYCATFPGVPVGLDGSENGITYQLWLNSVNTGVTGAGTGAAISFGNQTAAGTYTVIANNPSTGCEDTMNLSVDVTIDPLPTQFTVTGGGTYCAGGAGVDVGLDSTQPGVNYELFVNGGTTGTIVAGTDTPISFGNQLTAGTYTVIGTNTVTQCSDTMIDSVYVLIAPLPLIYNVTGGGSYCVGGPGLPIGLDGSQPGIKYHLIRDGINVVDSLNGTGFAVSYGNQTAAGSYIVTAIDTITGCSSLMPGNQSIIVNPIPHVSFTGLATNYCSNDPAVTLTGSEAPDGTFTSNAGAGLVDNGNGTATFTPTLAGVGGPYDVTYTYIDSLGCSDDTIMKVTINPIPNAFAGQDTTICEGQPAFLTAMGGTSYLWSTGSAFSGIIVNPTTKTTYTVTVSDLGCSNVDSVTIFVNPIPIADAGADVDICIGNSATLRASGGVHYEWSTTPPINNDSIVISPSITTIYTVTVYDEIGCSDLDDVTVTVHELPIIWTDPGAPVICEDSSVQITANGAFNYYWAPANKLSNDTGNTVLASPDITTTYFISGKSVFGCYGAGSVTVYVYPKPDPKISDSSYLCLGESITLDAGKFEGWHWYLWNDGSTSQKIIIEQPGLYWVKVSNPGCYAIDTILIKQCPELWVPNAFTPDGDGVNDIFKAKGVNIQEFQMFIYNRWGQMIFESNDINEGWDGTFKGEACKMDVYVWKIIYLGEGYDMQFVEEGKVIDGTVLLLR